MSESHTAGHPASKNRVRATQARGTFCHGLWFSSAALGRAGTNRTFYWREESSPCWTTHGRSESWWASPCNTHRSPTTITFLRVTVLLTTFFKG